MCNYGGSSGASSGCQGEMIGEACNFPESPCCTQGPADGNAEFGGCNSPAWQCDVSLDPHYLKGGSEFSYWWEDPIYGWNYDGTGILDTSHEGTFNFDVWQSVGK